MSVSQRIKQVQRSLDRIESGKYSELSLERCGDFLAWMKRFSKAPDSVLDPLIARVTAIWESGEYCPGYLR